MQVDPGFSQLTPRLLSGTFRDSQLLKLKYDKLVSNFAFKCNLRHYMSVHVMAKEISWFHAVIWPALLMVGQCRLTVIKTRVESAFGFSA